MNSNKIEKEAVRCLGEYLDSGTYIDSQIDSNEKGLLWDGYINIYKCDSTSKNDFMFRVPLQVKGKSVVKIESNISYPIETADLRAYLTEGTVFFVIQIAATCQRIFYKTLFPFTIKNLLDSHKGQKTINVHLKALTKPIDDFALEIMMFHGDCLRQISVLSENNKPMNLKDLSRNDIKGLTFRTPKKYDPLRLMSYLSTNPVYLYAQFNNGIEWPVGDEPVSLLFRKTAKLPIRVDDKLFYDDCVTEVRGDEKRVKGQVLDPQCN